MPTVSSDRAEPKRETYSELGLSLKGLLEGESDPIANLANASALLAERRM